MTDSSRYSSQALGRKTPRENVREKKIWIQKTEGKIEETNKPVLGLSLDLRENEGQILCHGTKSQ
jgi:hypothetical protein